MVLQEAVTGIRPLARSLDEAVLHRVPMYIQYVMVEVGIVTNTMLPVPALPHGPLTTSYARGGRDGAEMSGKRFGEPPFDAVPAERIIGVPFRQRPYRMEMIGKHHDRIDPDG
jgi:hypothetical protein